MPLALKPYSQLVSDEIAAIQAALPNAFQFQIGSIVLAIVQAHAGTALWEEGLVQFVLTQTRLATSTGTSCDTFVGDFGLTRLPATPSGGAVTFASFTFTTQRLIQVGTLIATQSPQPGVPTPVIGFSVVADPTNVNFNPSLNAYVMAPSVASISVPVIATIAGTGSNVAANTVTVIQSPIVGVDTVTNPAAFQNGANAQTDAQLRSYFVTYINSRSEATFAALSFAITNLGLNLKFVLVENIDYMTQTTRLGYFYAVIDNGAGGVPSMALQTTVRNALEVVRGFTIVPDVQPVILTTVNISATITIPAAYSNSSVNANTILTNDIITALSAYIELVPIGLTNDIYYSRIPQIIYNVIMNDAPAYISETNVSSVLLNGATADLAGDTKHEFTPGSIVITILND